MLHVGKLFEYWQIASADSLLSAILILKNRRFSVKIPHTILVCQIHLMYSDSDVKHYHIINILQIFEELIVHKS